MTSCENTQVSAGTGADPIEASYDEVPYTSEAYGLSHPCRTAAVARLFGLESPRVDGGRILELGCASGGNLIPLAQDFPDSTCLGVDISSRQIAEGKAVVAELGLSNIALRHLDINELDESLGSFDYIICHGVFSWVRRELQARILEIGRRLLTPSGVIYVSHNTNPGWKMLGIVRDMMRYHVADLPDPLDKVSQARALLDFLARAAHPADDSYRRLLQEVAERLRQRSDDYLFHEYLEIVNEPLYFHEFAEMVGSAGLQYLGESDFGTMLAEGFDPETARMLRDVPLHRQEQYMDFLRNRAFRTTLLCHREVALDRQIVPERITSFHVAFEEQANVDHGAVRVPGPVEITIGERTITVADPVTKAALCILGNCWPRHMPFADLQSEASELAFEGGTGADGGTTLAADLLRLAANRIVRFDVDPPDFVTEVSDRPIASPLARLQADNSGTVTNRRHEQMRLPVLMQRVLPLLDGDHDRAALRTEVRRMIDRGELTVEQAGRPVGDVSAEMVDELVRRALEGLARAAVVIG